MISFVLSVVDVVLIIAVSVLLILYITAERSTEEETTFKKPNVVSPAENVELRVRISRILPNLPILFLLASGSIILVWVGWLTWYDITTWGKDVASIFFGSRTGEAIGLGIGMIVLDYFLIGLALPLAGYVIFLRRRVRLNRFAPA